MTIKRKNSQKMIQILFEFLNKFFERRMISSHKSVVISRCIKLQAIFVHCFEDFLDCRLDWVFLDFSLHFSAEFQQKRAHLGMRHFSVAGWICHYKLAEEINSNLYFVTYTIASSRNSSKAASFILLKLQILKLMCASLFWKGAQPAGWRARSEMNIYWDLQNDRNTRGNHLTLQ